MKYNVTMPSLGADMEQGKLLEWHIKPGDVIKKGDLIAAVETQKAAVDIESFRAGTVLELIGEVDEIIHVGDVIATMEVADTDSAVTTSQKPVETVSASTVKKPIIEHEPAIAPPKPGITTSVTNTGSLRLRISPAARYLAEQSGIDIYTVQGSGHDGAIELHDVEKALASREKPAEKKSPAASGSMINVREAIARAMSRSKREIPHYYLQSQFPVDALVTWLDNKNRALPPEQRLFMPAVLMRAIVLALKTNPAMNGYYENGAFVPHSDIHLGITVALKPDGVMTPAIIDAHNMSLYELNTAFGDLVQRARAGKLRNREMTDGTVTVTNVGDLGADVVTGVIFPPQVALIGFGRIHKAAIVDGEGGLRACFVLDTTLAADHRVSDGLAGSKLLNTLGRLLAQPNLLET
jgi:pyruvate dehydrogenase E2 component (dihydrolipoamide acetyltransferase)